eukprot:TRINITY_DN19275_c0_g1_i1.p1 TRINITY_DN19275_c0_g1~~TRINITY_DN19275_c0_g1_i1.p1  ORF type:complete len:373 (+),score=51.20 TRINITY_DN19275_c0_g1_i1:63-1181(+)
MRTRGQQGRIRGNVAFFVLLVGSVMVLMINSWAARGRGRSKRLKGLTPTSFDNNEITDTIRIGIIADLQYADKDDGWDYSGTIKRRYRWPLQVLRNAIKNWSVTPIDLALNLGDTLDGWNAKHGLSSSALDTVQSVMRHSNISWRHLSGNHEFYNFPRRTLEDYLGYSTETSEKISTKWRLIRLDSYAVSVIGAKSTDLSEQGVRYLIKNNPNLANGNMTPGANVWLKDLVGKQRRFTPLNGGLGANQKRWLMQELLSAKRNGEWVVVASHIPIHPSAALDENLMWDYESTLSLLNTHGVGVVALFVAGHDHAGGFAIENKIPFITVPSPLESDDPHRYLTLSLSASRKQAFVSISHTGDFNLPQEVFSAER